MAFAFGVHSRLNDDFGKMRAYYQKWSANDGITYEEIPTRNCTAGDFGINTTRTDNRFYELLEDDVAITKKVMPSLRCIDTKINI